MKHENSKKIDQNIMKRVYNKEIFNRSKKKLGFTLIEVIAVIAIIGILTAATLPKLSGYIKEAKKVKVVDQCRKVVMAAESYALKYNPLTKTTEVSTMQSKEGVSKYMEGVTLNNLPSGTTLDECYSIVNGAEFDITGDNDMLMNNTIK